MSEPPVPKKCVLCTLLSTNKGWKLPRRYKKKRCTCRTVFDSYLKLGNLNLRKLPRNIGELTDNVNNLDVSDNKLQILPASIVQLNWLSTLKCNNNCFQKLPDVIVQLINLENLYVGENRFKFLPESIGKLKVLQGLYIDNNLLEELPKAIGELYNLQILNAKQNNLRVLPTTIGQLTQLTKLCLQGNYLVELPTTICNLINLRELKCSDNELTALPSNIGNLSNLLKLDCKNNKITELPQSMCKLKNLSRFKWENNPLQWPPISELERMSPIYDKSMMYRIYDAEKAIAFNVKKWITDAIAARERQLAYCFGFIQMQIEARESGTNSLLQCYPRGIREIIMAFIIRKDPATILDHTKK